MEIPEGWKKIPLSSITKEKISYGIVQAGPHIDSGVPYIKSSDVGKEINSSALQCTSPAIHHKYRRSSVHPGDIVFSLRGNIGATSIVPKELEEANLTQGTARISVSNGTNIHYVRYQLSSRPLLNRINSLSKGSTFREISLAELRKVEISLPPLPEQKKIAEILSTWDRAIEVVEGLIENSQAQKKALMQQLLTAKKRLPGFDGEWEITKLSFCAIINKGKALSSKNLNPGSYPVIAGGKTSPYTHSDYTHEGVLTISASGAYAGYVALHQNKIWASDCSVIQNNQNSDLNFIFQFLLLNQSKIYSLQSGGAQPHIYPKDLATLNISLPSLKEQTAIAAILSDSDREIELLTQQLTHLKSEKFALMQQLLTGKRRVEIDKEAAA